MQTITNNILYVFGDSHASNGWESLCTNVLIYYNALGPITMSRFGREHLNCLNIKNKNVVENSSVCFCFGEIDCRVHLCKPQNFKIYKELVNKLVESYFEAIKLNVEQYQNLNVFIYNIVPTVKRSTIIEDPDFPHTGSDEQRKEVTLYMNSKLKEYCKKYNYIFFDVYNKYCNNEGFLNWDLSDHTIHIKNPIYMKEFIDLNLIK